MARGFICNQCGKAESEEAARSHATGWIETSRASDGLRWVGEHPVEGHFCSMEHLVAYFVAILDSRKARSA